MRQINLHVTVEFLKKINLLMKQRHFKTKAQAIRTAIEEALLRTTSHKNVDFGVLLGKGLRSPQNPNRRFKSDDDIWGK